MIQNKPRPSYITYEQVRIQPMPCRRYQVKASIEVGSWLIPAGFITNGANIPRAFWSLIEPNQSNIMPAIILHDYLCDVADGTIVTNTKCTFKEADELFKQNLKMLDQAKWKVWLMYTSVRVYHYFKYEWKFARTKYSN